MLESIKSQYETTERRGTVQHVVHIREPKRPMPPEHVLDKIADEKLTGNWNVRKSNICPNCFTAKSVNGACSCTE